MKYARKSGIKTRYGGVEAVVCLQRLSLGRARAGDFRRGSKGVRANITLKIAVDNYRTVFIGVGLRGVLWVSYPQWVAGMFEGLCGESLDGWWGADIGCGCDATQSL